MRKPVSLKRVRICPCPGSFPLLLPLLVNCLRFVLLISCFRQKANIHCLPERSLGFGGSDHVATFEVFVGVLVSNIHDLCQEQYRADLSVYRAVSPHADPR